MKYEQDQQVRIIAICDDLDRIGETGKIIKVDRNESDPRPYQVQFTNGDGEVALRWWYSEDAIEAFHRISTGNLVYVEKEACDGYVGIAHVVRDDNTTIPYLVKLLATGQELWFPSSRLSLLNTGFKQYSITELATILARGYKLYANNGDTLSLANGEFFINVVPMKLEEQALRAFSYVNHTKDFEFGKVYKVWDNTPTNYVYKVIKAYNPFSIWKYIDDDDIQWKNAELLKQTV